MGKRKDFDRALYATYNALGCEIAKEYYKRKGIVLEDNPDEYGIDLIGKEINVEVEVRDSWKDNIFPWKEVCILERKAKNISGKTIFFIINQLLTKAILVKDEHLKPEYLKEKPNRLVSEGEYFYHIPRDKTEIVDITEEKKSVADWM